MDSRRLESFAIDARTQLIGEVTARLNLVLALASTARVEALGAIRALEAEIDRHGGSAKGRQHVAEHQAYVWFNRIIALRFMDANGYTITPVVSPDAGRSHGQPATLAAAKRGEFDPEVYTNPKIVNRITGLLNGTINSADSQGEAYGLILNAHCAYWNRAMPFMFQPEGTYTTLLMPANLLAEGSVLGQAVRILTPEDCRDVEVIGWLYQYYIAKRHGEVLAGFKKNLKAGADEIPAATQLFTPDWIVRYLVQNSLGRLWMLNHPSSRLVDQMDYYIAPVDEETDFLKITGPEELKVIDPACGSGHMLTYAFDLLYAIYEEEGYAPSEIPGLILANNLYGTEIDPRAGSLAAFALTMKARAKQRTFFNKQVEPSICALEPISFTPQGLDFLLTESGDRHEEIAFWSQFEAADTFGSLIRSDSSLIARLKRHIAELDVDGDLLTADVIDWAERVVAQAEFLAPRYAVAVTNPPYMGSGNMSTTVSAWIKEGYPDEKQDLYACFVVRSDELVVSRGYIAMVTGDTWMTIKSFEKLRRRLLVDHAFLSFVHMHDVSNHPDIFGANTAFVIGKDESPDMVGTYVHLDASASDTKAKHLRDAARGQAPERVFLAGSAQFAEIPGSPIVYRMPDALRAAFAKGAPLKYIADPRKGLGTGDADRFVRFWWEVAAGRTFRDATDGLSAAQSGAKWFPFNKGGEFRKWYGNQDYIVNWQADGREIRQPGAVPGARPQNVRFYFRPTVSWSKVSSGEPAFRYFPSGWIFSDAGLGLYDDERSPDYRALLALCNSSLTREMLKSISPTLNFEAGQIASLPFVEGMGEELLTTVEALTDAARDDWDSIEASRDFAGLGVIRQWAQTNLPAAVLSQLAAWSERARRQQLLESWANQLVAELYGVEDEVPVDVDLRRVSLVRNTAFVYAAGLSDDERRKRAVADFARELVSYAVGCMFGRYSLDEAGLILADQGATLQDFLAKVPTPSFTPDADNVIPIVDGDWFEDDIVARFRTFLCVAFGEEHLEENLRFVTESLGVRDIRDYFVRSFYKDHVQRYKTRPIYWMFSSRTDGKGAFNALVYLHRYTPATLNIVLNDYLREFQAKLRAEISGLERQQSPAAQKKADTLRTALTECEDYERDVLYPLASRNLTMDLDDGVLVNYLHFGEALVTIPAIEKKRDEVETWTWPTNPLSRSVG